MAKLYFKYGAMGSSKTAQALTTKFNYEERGMKVWLKTSRGHSFCPLLMSVSEVFSISFIL